MQNREEIDNMISRPEKHANLTAIDEIDFKFGQIVLN